MKKMVSASLFRHLANLMQKTIDHMTRVAVEQKNSPMKAMAR